MMRLGEHKPPVCKPGTILKPGHEIELGFGIVGFAFEYRGRIVIPVLSSTQKGRGYMSRFLESLDPSVFFVAVIMEPFEAMLSRRGWYEVQFEETSGWFHPAALPIDALDPWPWEWPEEYTAFAERLMEAVKK